MKIGAEVCVLSELATVQYGFPFRGAIRPTPGGTVCVVQMRDVSPEGIAWADAVRTKLAFRPDLQLNSGDLLFAARGFAFYALCVCEPPPMAVCSPHFFHLKVRAPSRVLPEFLSWTLNQPPVQRQVRQAAEGSDQLSIRRTELEVIRVTVPSMADQQRIVALARGAQREQQILAQLSANRRRQLTALSETLR